MAAASTPLRVLSITFGDPGAADIYIRNQRRVVASVGVRFLEVELPATMAAADALALSSVWMRIPR